PKPRPGGTGPFFVNKHKQPKMHRHSKERERKEKKEKDSIASSSKSSKSKQSSVTQVKPIHTNTGGMVHSRTRLNDMSSNSKVIEV
ncbi:hypothetical protein PMAYCL1PPCAC_04210, partial [Pristionchus mayeri]